MVIETGGVKDYLLLGRISSGKRDGQWVQWYGNGQKEVEVEAGSTILSTLGNNQIFLPSACGGGGTCGGGFVTGLGQLGLKEAPLRASSAPGAGAPAEARPSTKDSLRRWRRLERR